MIEFQIIPVLDLLKAEAVQAYKGERNEYRPLKSKLFESSNPLKIAEQLTRLGFYDIYIADLDSIMHRKPNLALISKILKIPGIQIILDPGIINKEDLLRFSSLRIKKLILGLETIEGIESIKEGIKIFGSNKIIVSIDLYKGRILSKSEELNSIDPIGFTDSLKNMDVEEIILLDLFRVGQKLGGIPLNYHKIRKNFSASILVGGGIRDLEDIKGLIQNNFNGALIATSLYDGTIDVEELKNILKISSSR